MDVPWLQAIQVGAVGFGMVFMLLVILGGIIWLTGRLFGKIETDEAAASKKKGE